jgi:hypothetical protein
MHDEDTQQAWLCDARGNPSSLFRNSTRGDGPATFHVEENRSERTILVAELAALHPCGKVTFTFQALPLGIQRSAFDVEIRPDGTLGVPSRVRLFD